MSTHGIRSAVAALGSWFHNIDLLGVPTAPDHPLGDYPANFLQYFAERLPDPAGRSVLDIGCNAGFFSLEMKRRGAARVVGIDSDPAYLAQARFAAATLGIDIEYRQLSVYDVASLGERFDIVLFMGVLYHLRHPLLALDLIREHAAADLLVFQCLQRGATDIAPVAPDYPFADRDPFEQPGWPRLSFIEHRYAGDLTNWWIPNRAAAEAMLRNAGFAILHNADTEVYLCRIAPPAYGAAPVYPTKGAHP